MLIRDIEFRAFEKRGQFMSNVGELNFLQGGMMVYGPGVSLGNGWASCEKEFSHTCDVILMQYTGVLDISAKKIYDGDIVVQDGYPFFSDGKSNYVGVVEWVFSQWQVVLYSVNKNNSGGSNGINQGLNESGVLENQKTHWKIIGNIYENANILKSDN